MNNISDGKIPLREGYTFRWTRRDSDKAPEVYGWVEGPEQYAIVKGTGGWYRTADPTAAAAVAQFNLEHPMGGNKTLTK